MLYVDVPYPLQSSEHLVDAYDQMLRTHDNIRLVLLGSHLYISINIVSNL